MRVNIKLKVTISARQQSSVLVRDYTANVCRDLQELCREIGVRGFQIPVIFEVNQKKSVDFLYIHFIRGFQAYM